MRGIKVFSKEIKLSQFTDDTNLVNADTLFNANL